MGEQQANLLITLLALAISSGLVSTLLIAARRALEARLGIDRVQAATQIAHSAVAAIEQTSTGRDWTNPERLRVALDQARSLGQAHGIVLSDPQWKTLLEAGVLAMSQAQEALAASATPVSALVVAPVSPASPVAQAAEGALLDQLSRHDQDDSNPAVALGDSDPDLLPK